MGFSLMANAENPASCAWLHPLSFDEALTKARELVAGWDVRIDPKLVIDYREGIMLRFTNETNDEVFFNAAKVLLDYADGGAAYAQTPIRNAMKAKGWIVPDGR